MSADHPRVVPFRTGNERPIADGALYVQVEVVSRKVVPLLIIASLTSGCEPTRGVVAEKDQPDPVDLACVDRTLRKEFGSVERSDFTSDGTPITQFGYFQSNDGRGRATLEVGETGHGTSLRQAFTGAGSELPQEDFPPAFQAMDRAALALHAACGLHLRAMERRAVGQQVEALNGS